MPTLVFADGEYEDDEDRGYGQGDLHIRSQTIQDGQVALHDHFRPIGYEIAPFLFLEDMMEVENQRVAQNNDFIRTTRESLFLEEVPNIRFDTSEIIDRLFTDEGVSDHQSGAVGVRERYFHVPTWVIMIGIVVATGFLVYVAVIFGQKLGHVIHKNKEGEVASG